MPLQPGDKLGPYEILAPIGKGGMGEVYRAHDARTGRDVAVKVSAERFNERFDREVRAVAALNHLNICHLYDVGPNYLVMELVEGQTLADLIRKGAIPLEEALKIAAQIAAALEAAHEKEITHRDLKPANIKITPAGVVKVLDFGLAQLSRDREGAESDPEHSIQSCCLPSNMM
jgi:serine/threonine protein kinase